MPIYVYAIDKISKESLKHMKFNGFAPDWPFRLLVCGGFHSGKTNMVVNLMLEKHSEPKWQLVQTSFQIFTNSPKPY
ncbi:hypothetical protein GLOIN_2v1787825 [Rhizophagus irregularis DAOM 181602=DAOM 197198]|nr:hypothetical protein GLOIN_2v1787825 [Rhizophagus irregularis DAOM 181602=DAOM 197198]